MDGELAGQGFGSGHGRLAGSHRSKPPRIIMFDAAAWLRDALTPGWKACGGGGRAATVAVETTLAEVVDVPRVTIEGAADAKVTACLEEAVWGLELPGAFDLVAGRYDVTL